MRSVVHALLWDSFRLSGWVHLIMLAVCMFPLLIYSIILSVAPAGVQPVDPVMFLLEVSLLPFVMFVLLMAAGTTFSNMSQLYTKPISNLSIAVWRTLGGSILLAADVGVMVAFYNQTYNVGWPLAGAILFTITAWFTAQPFLCLAGKSIMGTIITMIPLALMSFWLYTRYKPIGAAPRDWNEINLFEAFQLLVIIVLFAWPTVTCVGWARRGDGFPVPASISEWFRKVFSFPTAYRQTQKPFASTRSALFWYEWRWKGWAMCASMLFLLAVIVPVNLTHLLSVQSYYDAVTSAYIGTFVPAMLVGVTNGFQLESMQVSTSSSSAASSLSDIDELRSFQATRPVSDGELSRGSLWVCLASVSLIVGFWLVLVAPVIAISAWRGTLEQQFVSERFVVVPAVTLSIWICQSNLTSLTSTGRTKQLGSILVTLLLIVAFLPAMLDWVGNQAFTQLAMQSLLVVFTASLAAFATWAFSRSCQLKLIDRASVIWLMLVAALIAFVCAWIVGRLDIMSVSVALCAGILSVLPWATTPLATRWNRHR